MSGQRQQMRQSVPSFCVCMLSDTWIHCISVSFLTHVELLLAPSQGKWTLYIVYKSNSSDYTVYSVVHVSYLLS